MNKFWLQRLLALIAFSLLGSASGQVGSALAQPASRPSVRNPDQVPTVRYARGEDIDLALVIDEWRDRYPDIAVFTCTCSAETCGDPDIWPYREFSRYQPTVALGENNAAISQDNGFHCFDMETGARPASDD